LESAVIEKPPAGPKTVRTIAALRIGAQAVGAVAFGALALGALTIGALAVGALAIGKLGIRHARLGRVEIDELVVRKLRVTDEFEEPDRTPHEQAH
jgi:predicted nucleic acid-binding protein